MRIYRYEMEFRVPTSPRKSGARGHTYLDQDYRDGQYEFRKRMIETYGHFETIQPTKRVPESVKKNRPEQAPYRNVLVSYRVLLAGNTAVDEDNIGKFLFDTLGPISAKSPTKKDIALGWVPLYRNDRQVLGGHHIVVDQWEYNHLQLEVVHLETPEEYRAAVDRWEPLEMDRAA